MREVRRLTSKLFGHWIRKGVVSYLWKLWGCWMAGWLGVHPDPLCPALLETSLFFGSTSLAAVKIEAGLIEIFRILPKVFTTADRGGILGVWSAGDFESIEHPRRMIMHAIDAM